MSLSDDLLALAEQIEQLAMRLGRVEDERDTLKAAEDSYLDQLKRLQDQRQELVRKVYAFEKLLKRIDEDYDWWTLSGSSGYDKLIDLCSQWQDEIKKLVAPK